MQGRPEDMIREVILSHEDKLDIVTEIPYSNLKYENSSPKTPIRQML